MNAIDENTREQVAGLATRAKHLSRRLMPLAVVFGLLLFGMFGAFFLTHHLEPSTALTSVDVPEKTFEVAGGLDLHKRLNDAFSMFRSLSKVLGVIFVGIGGGAFLGDNSNGGKGVIFIMLGLMAIASGSFLKMAGFTTENNFFASTHPHVVREIKKNDFSSVRQKLKLEGRADEPVGLYLLAQMSIVEGENQMDITGDVIDRILSPAAGFTPDTKALYAIEHAAYGRPKSEAAIAYRDKLLSWQRWMQWMTMILAGAAIVAGCFLAGLACVRYAIVGRVQRIERLCGMT